MTAEQTGLRERKKRATRALIADTALRLFKEHGFDQTTVAEVAAAAGVSVKTVFNYFPAKEDLFFDRDEEIRQVLLDAADDVQPGESPLAGLRRRVVSVFAHHPPERTARFRAVIAGSSQLQARAQRMRADYEDALTIALARRLGVTGDDPTPRAVAHHVLSVPLMIIRMGETWSEQGATPDEVRDRSLTLINRSYDILEHGFLEP